MDNLNEYFNKARGEKEIIPLVELDDILSSKQQAASSHSPGFWQNFFERKDLRLATLSITIVAASVILFVLARHKTHAEQEVFVPQAQRRVMQLVKNISDRPANQRIAISGFGPSTQVAGIPIHLRSKFELSEDKLKLLGFTFTDEIIKYEGNAKGKGYVKFSIAKSTEEARFSEVDITLLIGPTRAGVKEYEFSPWFLTDENGVQGPRYEFGGREPAGKMTNSFFLNAIDELIPIEINRHGFKKVIFWFSQTPELMKILESAAMISNNTGTLPGESPEKGTRTIQIEIFPTITKGDVQVIATVLKQQKLEISILNSSGEVVQAPVNNQTLKEGDHRFSMDLSTFRKGLYFVRIKSDPGLVTIHRLFKE